MPVLAVLAGYFAVAAAFIIGWVINIIELVNLIDVTPVPVVETLLRIIGIPIFFFGTIMGYFV